MKRLDDISVTELLCRLIRFPSVSRSEKELADWLYDAVQQTGLLETERFGNNLVFSLGEGRPWLLLNTHSDVVPPSSAHTGNAFEPREEHGRIYGRGSTDAKGSLSCMLMALIGLAASGYRPPGRVSLAITVCEETAGEFNGMAELRERLPRPDAALVGEPTMLAPCVAQKGLLILKLTASGEAGHAARVTGPNAIYEMAKQLQKLKTLQFAQRNPFIGDTRITPTTIEGGTARNAHPDRCTVYLDIRTIPEVPNQQIVDRLQQELDLQISIHSDRFVSTKTEITHTIARVAAEASGEAFFGSPTTSDWVFLADVPTVKIGPGDSRDSHTANESIAVEQLNKGVELYRRLIPLYFSTIERGTA